MINIPIIMAARACEYYSNYQVINHTDLPQEAIRCAIEGEGSCSGPGIVYFGATDSRYDWYDPYGWYTQGRYLTQGQSIDCNSDAFGCDPFAGFRKECVILPACPLDNTFCEDKSDGNYETPNGYLPNYYIACSNHIQYCMPCPANLVFIKSEDDDDNWGKCEYLS